MARKIAVTWKDWTLELFCVLWRGYQTTLLFKKATTQRHLRQWRPCANTPTSGLTSICRLGNACMVSVQSGYVQSQYIHGVTTWELGCSDAEAWHLLPLVGCMLLLNKPLNSTLSTTGNRNGVAMCRRQLRGYIALMETGNGLIDEATFKHIWNHGS